MRLEAYPGATIPGQRGTLRLKFEHRGGRTALSGRRTSTPFGAVRACYPDGSGMAEVQITNPAGGVLGGDRLAIDVSLFSGSAATILTQGATKAYRGEEAHQDAVFEVGENAFLEYLPHHLIPYTGSNYRQTTEFHLAGDATLVAWDACAAGRVARGERFAFGSLGNRTKIFRCGAPEAVEGFELPEDGEPFGGYSYLGSLYVISAEDLSALADKLHHAVDPVPGTLASASVPSPNFCVIRTLTRDAPGLYKTLNDCRTTVRAFLRRPAAPRHVW